MSIKPSVLLAVAVASAALTTVAAAGSAAPGQRIAITARSGNVDEFVLTPLSRGDVMPDSGATSVCCFAQRFAKLDGQSIEITNPLRTFVGKRGTFAYRARVEWVDAGNGYTVGTGTWKIVRGTGAYRQLQGSGRLAISWPPGEVASWRAEGNVVLRDGP